MSFMEDHPRFGHNQLVGQLGRETKTKLTEKLVSDLNSDPLGPLKNTSQWTTVRFFHGINVRS
jgi:hypothetical protein